MSDATTPATPTARTAGASNDTKAIIRSIVATGIGLATLILMLAGLTIQQNAAVNTRFDDANTRIDDVNASVNARFDDVHRRFDDQTARFDDQNASVNARFDDMNVRFDDMREDIRELRALIVEALKRTDPAD